VTPAASPNFDARPGPVTCLVFHYTGMQTAQAAIDRLCDPAARVSAHYVVDEDGTVICLVPEDRRAWHAGVSFWRGVTNLNDVSIGIEIVNPGHEWGYVAFPEAQMLAVAELAEGIIERHAIPAVNIVGHADIAPDRKQDPGELFPWKALAEEGVGLWSDADADEGNLKQDLAAIGYDVRLPAAAIIRAFQRRFLAENLSGRPDEATARRAAGVRALYEGRHVAHPSYGG
jgi:N-acetylmuramoyl-L-alanine amidase